MVHLAGFTARIYTPQKYIATNLKFGILKGTTSENLQQSLAMLYQKIMCHVPDQANENMVQGSLASGPH